MYGTAVVVYCFLLLIGVLYYMCGTAVVVPGKWQNWQHTTRKRASYDKSITCLRVQTQYTVVPGTWHTPPRKTAAAAVVVYRAITRIYENHPFCCWPVLVYNLKLLVGAGTGWMTSQCEEFTRREPHYTEIWRNLKQIVEADNKFAMCRSSFLKR